MAKMANFKWQMLLAIALGLLTLQSTPTVAAIIGSPSIGNRQSAIENQQSGAPAVKPRNWALVSKQALDPRISHQIAELAAQHERSVATFKSRGQASRSHPDLTLELEQAKSAPAFLRELKRATPGWRPTLAGGDEGYIVSWTYHRSSVPGTIHILAAGPPGFHGALLRLPDLLRLRPSSLRTGLFPAPKRVSLRSAKGKASALMADFPSFPVRGVVEGFYGTPWSQQDRLDMLRFEGLHGLNTYYYAPKDDPYHRQQWRDPYPADRLASLGELAQTARANFVDFCFAVSPGLSMVYSSDDDFAKLTAKFDSVGKLGVACFALFLDDVPEELQNPPDQARFKSLADAHAYLSNRLYRYLTSLSPENHLTVTPTIYTDAFGHTDYIRELGAAVDPHVDLVWTGTEVVSPEITAAQARHWSKLLERPPLIWDNFPVNDGISWRLVLGPLIGRDPDLNVAVRGLVSNPMVQAHASMIPLQTVAEYLWNPHAYSAQEAERRALVSQYGQDAPQLLAPFLLAYGDYWWQDNNIFKPLWHETRLPIDLPRMDRLLASMDSALQGMSASPQFAKLVSEIAPFAEKTSARAAALAADPAFRRLADGRLHWNEDYATLTAQRLSAPPALDGDFTKWQRGPVYSLRFAGPLEAPSGAGGTGNGSFDGRFALAWDDHYLYVGVDIGDPDIYQPPPVAKNTPGDIADGDMVALALETAFHQNYYATSAGPDAFAILASPGNFNGVAANLYVGKDDRAPRIAGNSQGIKVTWKKTAEGYSGDVVIPAAVFEGGKLEEGYEIGLLVGAQKVLPAAPPVTEEGKPQRIHLTSQKDLLFRPNSGNPASFQRLVLVGEP